MDTRHNVLRRDDAMSDFMIECPGIGDGVDFEEV